MDELFKARLTRITSQFNVLRASEPFRFPIGRRALPMQGVYLFSENGHPKYVGRSDNIRRRLGLHTRAGSSYSQASFATLLAKKNTGLAANYLVGRDHPHHFSNKPEFTTAFAAAKLSIQNMTVQVAEEADAVNQALLEVYIAVALKTPFNDFRNH